MAGRKVSRNPKNSRITILLTAAERVAWEMAAIKLADGNISALIRQTMKRVVTEAVAPAAEATTVKEM